MAIYPQYESAMNDRDADAFIALLHDDFKFVSHQTGTTMDKSEMSEMIGNMMSSGSLSIHNQRCLYENDDILVEHAVMDFPDGTREAVLSVNKISGGKITETETGATLIPSQG